MNDEASVHYVDIINQITEGNEWLHFNFGVKPKIRYDPKYNNNNILTVHNNTLVFANMIFSFGINVVLAGR